MSDEAQAQEPRYVLDSSALFDLKNDYPRASFPSLWSRFDALCAAGVIIAPREVRREIERGSDELPDWAQVHGHIFLPPTAAEASIVGQLQVRNPSWIPPSETKPIADPFLIAMASEKGLPLITHDTRLMPFARDMEVECIRIPDLVSREGWQF